MYRVKFYSEALSAELRDIQVSEIWAAWHIMGRMIQQSHLGDHIEIYNPMGEIIEVYHNDGFNPPDESLDRANWRRSQYR